MTKDEIIAEAARRLGDSSVEFTAEVAASFNYVIQDLAGHKSIETTRRYIHVNEEQKRQAIMNAFG